MEFIGVYKKTHLELSGMFNNQLSDRVSIQLSEQLIEQLWDILGVLTWTI